LRYHLCSLRVYFIVLRLMYVILFLYCKFNYASRHFYTCSGSSIFGPTYSGRLLRSMEFSMPLDRERVSISESQVPLLEIK
jgi:hypothetical protein